MKANLDIRADMKKAGVFQWEIADQLGISEGTFSKRVRHEMSDDEKAAVRHAIAEITRARAV